MPSLRHWFTLVGESLATVTGVYAYAQHVAYLKMHTIPAGLPHEQGKFS
ncbi:MAG: hypothetical protein JWP72_3356 [Massilia sp.]|nr:hypothetical protein [Massilia sp.]